MIVLSVAEAVGTGTGLLVVGITLGIWTEWEVLA